MERTYTHNTNLFFEGAGSIGIGTFGGAGNPASPDSKLDVNGQIQARSGFAASPGTANTPSYGFYTNGDTDMGMYRIAADQLGFSTDGVEAIRINATQNVGIGPAFAGGATIDARLHVDGDVYATGDFFSTSGDAVGMIPDYVFQKYFNNFSPIKNDYEFKSLEQIEKFLKLKTTYQALLQQPKPKKMDTGI